ncbi:rhodanese-like domain-containing protein [Actinokineospora cianjurensis]|uniref:Rhodanese-related sulfurtransferase n=1 Tax=Actinokineospora cianjurensis TaxID=585224 RepID=A0A421B754_9PSEU|nr:rhodanese-like domain-containing protein [Actinokineospora cianjurensis]RLK60128.1 rhodanese-related sulfurtransferase [Actinokineospora cianjurensis]
MPSSVPTATVDAIPADAVLLDVREQDEWDAGHAPSAQHIPMGELTARLDELPADAQVFVICRSGGRSARVTQYLNGNGWDAVNVDGGMQTWSALGQPVVSASGQDPQVI